MPDERPKDRRSDDGTTDSSPIDLQDSSPPPPLPVLVGVIKAQPEQQTGYVFSESPRRHGCLTSYLVFVLGGQIYLIALNVLTFRSLVFPAEATHGRTVPPFVAALFILISICDILCINALFKWRRWGLYGIVIIIVLIFLLNIVVGVNPAYATFIGVSSVGLLFWALSIGGKRRSAWRHLK